MIYSIHKTDIYLSDIIGIISALIGLYTEAPGQISVLSGFIACWQKRTDVLLAGSDQNRSPTIIIITVILASLASC